MAIKIGRREFVGTLGSVAVGWPLAARAQQSAMPVVAFLDAASFETEVRGLAEFRRGLSEIGYVEGENVIPTG
jgi:putative ABC transport system substrate-binding protein